MRRTKRDSDDEGPDYESDESQSIESARAFVPLETANGNEEDESSPTMIVEAATRLQNCLPNISAKKVISTVLTSLFVIILWDAVMRDPEDRFLRPDFAERFLQWVQDHPLKGIVAFFLVIATAVVLMIPIGTPLTVGCGYIYKGAYGWKLGLTLATFVALGGSALGAVICFLLGRYLMREQVRKWVRKYPLFDAIDMGK
jgi:uncharacterized membrane protein YdjX (TVP38/TMEM64 family)